MILHIPRLPNLRNNRLPDLEIPPNLHADVRSRHDTRDGHVYGLQLGRRLAIGPPDAQPAGDDTQYDDEAPVPHVRGSVLGPGARAQERAMLPPPQHGLQEEEDRGDGSEDLV